MEIEYRKNAAANGRMIVAMLFASALMVRDTETMVICVGAIVFAWLSDLSAAMGRGSFAAIFSMAALFSVMASFISTAINAW